jgi:hypothetical protein
MVVSPTRQQIPLRYALFFLFLTPLFAPAVHAQPAPTPQEWAAVETWDGNYRTTVKSTLNVKNGYGSTIEWSIEGTVHLKLSNNDNGWPVWSGGDEANGVYKSTVKGPDYTSTEEGSSGHSSTVDMFILPDLYFLNFMPWQINTKVTENGQSFPGVQLLLPNASAPSVQLLSVGQEITGRNVSSSKLYSSITTWSLVPTSFAPCREDVLLADMRAPPGAPLASRW